MILCDMPDCIKLRLSLKVEAYMRDRALSTIFLASFVK
jgi:hypothetical protein